MSFVHLHVHSHYSLLSASCTVPALIDKCLEFKMPAMALTDYGNMFGALEFYFSALSKGIQPILACEMYYVEDYNKKEKWTGPSFRHPIKYNTVVLLSQNLEGYKNLCRINTLAHQKGFYFVPRADLALLEKCKSGLIALTGGSRGSVPCLFRSKGKDFALKEIQKLKSLFGSKLYLQLAPLGFKDSEAYNIFLAEVGKSENLPLVAGGDVHYIEKKDSLVQDILFCIGTNRTLSDKERLRLGPSEFYFKSPDEMRGMFKNHPAISDFYKQAFDNTLEIAQQCHVRFKTKDREGRPIYHLPQIEGEKDLKDLAIKGLESRLKEAHKRGEIWTSEKKSKYIKRLHYELEIIERMGFKGYFYIVYDFISWAKQNGIPVGPGRGSGASSLVSFCLGITDLDPMPLNLIFERFLNPERISMPDFDIDFCQEHRGRVIDYIAEKYGSEHCSHVITYGKLSVRAALRDVGRVLALNYSEVDQVAKLVPDILGITLKEALKKEPRLKKMADEDPKIAEWLQLTALLEGLVRHVGLHAAGIIIADTPIVHYAPLCRGADGENVIQYDLKQAEKIGLVKFDFLGLKTLTVMAEAFRLIEKNRGKRITTGQISLKDSGIYEIMSRGDTAGIFQFEGAGITDLLIKSQPTCFEDIVAINALYRPGPMSMIPSYLDRKKARVPVEYIFPQLEPILKETYGIIVYQEQVQQIAVEIAGYSYGEADVLRRAMGKKIQSVMKRQKNRFLEGAKKKGYPLKKSEELFELMAEFAKYGFNKSHAAAYCVLAAQTAYLKHYYTVEFLSAQMTVEQNDSDKLLPYIRDAREHGTPPLSPHVNSSSFRFTLKGGKIHFSLGAIKGVGLSAAKEIVRAREKLESKKFSDLEEFFEHVDLKKINKKTLESLIKSGALDGFGYKRREIFENIERFSRYGLKQKEDQMSGQKSLFDSHLGKDGIQITKIEPWSRKERLAYEKESFGFYLNDHPMKALEGLESSLGCKTISQLKRRGLADQTVKALALISHIREIVTKKKSQLMAFAVLEDGAGSMEAILFPEVYEKAREKLLQEGEVFCLTGSLKKDRGRAPQLVVEKLLSLDSLLEQIQKIEFKLSPDMESQNLSELKNLLSSSPPGPSSVRLKTYIPEKKAFVEIDTQGKLKDIKITHSFLQRLRKIFKTAEPIGLFRS